MTTETMIPCRDCGKLFRFGQPLDLPAPTRCMECLIGREAEVARLREALEEIADDECTSYRESGRSCEWLGQKWPEGYCYPCIARLALSPGGEVAR